MTEKQLSLCIAQKAHQEKRKRHSSQGRGYSVTSSLHKSQSAKDKNKTFLRLAWIRAPFHPSRLILAGHSFELGSNKSTHTRINSFHRTVFTETLEGLAQSETTFDAYIGRENVALNY
ncbi:hypothetical protein TNCV_1578311 [Trichonephila clavipes]|nr:hypothetical protein TNCV_1578311 [Trichonephila clavipes]